MANYEKAFPVILKFEGGLCDDPEDSGGITKYGVCLEFAKDTHDLKLFDKDGDGDIDRQDIKKLSVDDASRAFKKYFWDKYQLDDLDSNKMALVVFDSAVNHGRGNATAFIQKTLNKFGYHLMVDGLWGPKTRNALQTVDDPDEFCAQMISLRRKFYNTIVENRPKQKVFLKGWLNRLKSLQQVLAKWED